MRGRENIEYLGHKGTLVGGKPADWIDVYIEMFGGRVNPATGQWEIRWRVPDCLPARANCTNVPPT
jgi:hypothetical protein